MRLPSRLALVAAAALLSGCYHAVVETGRPAGDQRIDQLWAKSWIYGLVPPEVVQTASTCNNGVSRVETRHSFLNGLVGAITFGIFTPMEIRVTCASRGSSSIAPSAAEITAPVGASSEQKEELLSRAVMLSAETGQAVVVRF